MTTTLTPDKATTSAGAAAPAEGAGTGAGAAAGGAPTGGTAAPAGKEAPATLEDIGKRAQALFAKPGDATTATARPASQDGANKGAGAAGQGDPGKAVADETFIAYKANGQEKKVKASEAAEILSSYEGFLKERDKIKAEARAELEELAKPYQAIRHAAAERESVSKAVALIAKHPSLADLLLDEVVARAKDGRITRDQLDAERLRLEQKVAGTAAKESKTQADLAEGQKLLGEHLGEIAAKHGRKVEQGDAYFLELVKVMQETGLRDIRDAADMHAMRTGAKPAAGVAGAAAPDSQGKPSPSDEAKAAARVAAGLPGGANGATGGKPAAGRASVEDWERIGERAVRVARSTTR